MAYVAPDIAFVVNANLLCLRAKDATVLWVIGVPNVFQRLLCNVHLVDWVEHDKPGENLGRADEVGGAA